MNFSFKKLTTVAINLATLTAVASPNYLITHNTTNVESNAYIAGTIPSPKPTPAHSNSKVLWAVVRMSCYGHSVNKQCAALIKMNTNTANPVELGTVTMDIESGDITPKQLVTNDYTLTVNGPGETTLSAN